jgi:hypothetical protein
MPITDPAQSNDLIWSANPGPQSWMINCPVFEVFFGGARGGGKTAGVLGDWANHASTFGEHANGLMVRRSLAELQDTIRESKAIYRPIGAEYNESGKFWVMPNAAKLTFAYLENDEDAQRYQGWNLSRLYAEECGNFPSPDPLMKLKATLRSKKATVGFRLTGNPGGPGHQWVKARYIDPAPLGCKVITDENGLDRIFIPSRLQDNPKLLEQDPDYIARLKSSGSKELVRAWLEGDWSVVTGAYFPEFSISAHVIPPFTPPRHWTRIRGMDWGSHAPFAVLWAAVSDGIDTPYPVNSLVIYREWYGWNGQPNKGCRMTAQEVGERIREIERLHDEKVDDEVLDPAAFSSDGGPSIAERLDCNFRRADNRRIQRLGVSGGWDAVRERLRGTDSSEHKPLLYIASDCIHTIRTLPALQHDPHRMEDVDTTGEDHAADTLRYICLSRPITQTAKRVENRRFATDLTFNEIVKRARERRLERD